MFAWAKAKRCLCRMRLAGGTAGLCRRQFPCSASALLRGLPALGCVLYLPTARPCVSPLVCWPDLVLESPELLPLLQTAQLSIVCSIDPAGPCEWIDCLDRRGRVLGRFYLLPDSDYLAWEYLTALGGTAVETSFVPGQRWRPADQARVVGVEMRQLGGLTSFYCQPALSLSALGRRLASEWARTERVELAECEAAQPIPRSEPPTVDTLRAVRGE